VTRPKHERLIEKMMDAYWNTENTGRSVTDPERMRAVVAVIQAALRAQPRSMDCDGSLEWAADWLGIRLEEDAE
jgi:hypothetical protein